MPDDHHRSLFQLQRSGHEEATAALAVRRIRRADLVDYLLFGVRPPDHGGHLRIVRSHLEARSVRSASAAVGHRALRTRAWYHQNLMNEDRLRRSPNVGIIGSTSLLGKELKELVEDGGF